MPRSGSVGKSLLVIWMPSKLTMRETRSTRVRAVAVTTPNVSPLAPVGLIATALLKSIWLPTQPVTWGA